jgi:hypothetical protein
VFFGKRRRQRKRGKEWRWWWLKEREEKERGEGAGTDEAWRKGMSGGEDQETWTGTREGSGVSRRKRRRRLARGVLATREEKGLVVVVVHQPMSKNEVEASPSAVRGTELTAKVKSSPTRRAVL